MLQLSGAYCSLDTGDTWGFSRRGLPFCGVSIRGPLNLLADEETPAQSFRAYEQGLSGRSMASILTSSWHGRHGSLYPLSCFSIFEETEP